MTIRDIIEFHIGESCGCEEGHGCSRCALYMELEEREKALELKVKWCYEQFTKIQDCHTDCNVPDSEHKMFNLAQEGIEEIYRTCQLTTLEDGKEKE